VNCGAAVQAATATGLPVVEAAMIPVVAPTVASYAQPVAQPSMYAPPPGQGVWVQPNGQAVYYVSAPAQVAHVGHQVNMLHGLQAKIQGLASTEDLDGFSLKQMFSEVFRKRSEDEIEDYL
jgi:hypothetical protein